MAVQAREIDAVVIGTPDPTRVAHGLIRLATEWRQGHPNWATFEAHRHGCPSCSADDPCPEGARLDRLAAPEREAHARLLNTSTAAPAAGARPMRAKSKGRQRL
jgi:hypothetical protein